ncbi:glycosyltransferase [Candidatus Altiarchaeota archaeon]
MVSEEDKPIVSVIVPTYNRGGMLGDCIGSLQQQSYPNLEIILVDDGSTDDTLKVLEEYAGEDERIRVFSQENNGSYSARNLGIKESKGGIICFTDDDCIVDKEWVSRLVAAYDDERVGGVGGQIIAYPPENMIERYCDEIGLLGQERLSSVYFMTANASYRMSVLEEVGGFDTYFKSSGDADMGVMVHERGYATKYARDAVIHHRHRSTLRNLVRQKFFHGTGYSCMHRKYAKNFNPGKMIAKLAVTGLKGLVLYPFMMIKAVTVHEPRFYLTKRFLDVALIYAYMAGIIHDSLFGRKYTGDRHEKAVPPEVMGSTPGGWGS